MLSPIPSPIPFPKQWHWNRAHCIILYPKLKKNSSIKRTPWLLCMAVMLQNIYYFIIVCNIFLLISLNFEPIRLTVLFFTSKSNSNRLLYYTCLLVLEIFFNMSRWLDNIAHIENDILIKNLLSSKDVFAINLFPKIRNVTFKCSKILNPILKKYMRRRYYISYKK